MVEDYPSTSITTETHHTNKLLNDLEALLLQHGKQIREYDLPISTGERDNDSAVPGLIQDELTVPNVDEELSLIEKLNNDQRVAYEIVMTAIDRKESMIFFVDGPGGTGKTFLYRTILATLRKAGHIAIATATSGIAATLLPGGRTAHSRFKIPLTPDASSTCSISKQSDLAELIRRATIIIWDEAPMCSSIMHVKIHMTTQKSEQTLPDRILNKDVNSKRASGKRVNGITKSIVYSKGCNESGGTLLYWAQSTNHGDHGCMVDSLSCIGLLKAKELVRAMLQREASLIW
ncbi:hypothetical protein SO802_006554 [Lithocarpus litseifolius]|uniref:ATP-dependent DNA helicase n=1 Tax=Lithocarpus litseifolius TaxID=425828 RepID=A0AAW2DQZ9_9ROSI